MSSGTTACPDCGAANAADHNYCKHCGVPLKVASVDHELAGSPAERMRDRYDLFGSIPDTIKDEWIADIETLGEKMDQYIDARKRATGFDLRYTGTMTAGAKDWRDCTEVLSRRDFTELMSVGWGA